MSTEILIERWLWLIISLGLALVAIGTRLTLELLEKRAPDNALVRAQLLDNSWMVQPLRILYAVGIPAGAMLWRGTLTGRGLGLKPLHVSPAQGVTNWDVWAVDLGQTFVMTACLGLIIALGERRARRVGPPYCVQRRFGVAFREALYHQVHWAFYREPFVLLWGVAAGAWGGLLLVAVEAIINPARWADLQSPYRGRDLLVRVGLAVLSVMLYIQTQNLWLAILADTALGWALGQAQPAANVMA